MAVQNEQAVGAGQIVLAVETAWADYTYAASQTVQAVEAVPDVVVVQIVPAAVDVQIVPAVWILAGITSDSF